MSEIDGAIYSSPPNRGATAQDNTNLPVGAKDTGDLYNDEENYAEHEEGHAYGVGQIPAEAELSEPESPQFLAISLSSLGLDVAVDTPHVATRVPQWNTDPRVIQEGDRLWTASIEVDTKLHGFLIGKQYRTALEIETATQCKINFPTRVSNSPHIRIISTVGPANVESCLCRIEETVNYYLHTPKSVSINKKEPTHFASIPCNDTWIRRRFLAFKELIMTSKEVHPSCQVEALFPPKMKLHLTICLMQLQTHEDKELATKTMAMLKEKYSKRRPLEVHVDGLYVTNDDPTKVHVLFAKIHGDGVQELVDNIRDELHKARLFKMVDKEKVQLHMTVMNSRYATKDENGNSSRDYRDRKPFNARWILKEHEDWSFGTFTLNRFTICTIDTEDECGYYECLFDEKLE